MVGKVPGECQAAVPNSSEATRSSGTTDCRPQGLEDGAVQEGKLRRVQGTSHQLLGVQLTQHGCVLAAMSVFIYFSFLIFICPNSLFFLIISVKPLCEFELFMKKMMKNNRTKEVNRPCLGFFLISNQK